MIFGADENQSTFGWLKQSGSGTVFWKENEGMRRSIIHAEGVLRAIWLQKCLMECPGIPGRVLFYF